MIGLSWKGYDLEVIPFVDDIQDQFNLCLKWEWWKLMFSFTILTPFALETFLISIYIRLRLGFGILHYENFVLFFFSVRYLHALNNRYGLLNDNNNWNSINLFIYSFAFFLEMLSIWDIYIWENQQPTTNSQYHM